LMAARTLMRGECRGAFVTRHDDLPAASGIKRYA
jgi:hypothetical protein